MGSFCNYFSLRRSLSLSENERTSNARTLFGPRLVRERIHSVNDFNIPHDDINEINPLMDKCNLVGDFSRTLSLPVTNCGKHSDLKYITSQTLVDLLQGKLPYGKEQLILPIIQLI